MDRAAPQHFNMQHFKMSRRKAWGSAAWPFAPAMNPHADMLNYRRQQTETDRGGGGVGGLSKCLTGFDSGCVWLAGGCLTGGSTGLRD